MKTISKCGAQGDVILRRVGKLPDGAEPAADKIVTHSETGHHHVAIGDAVIHHTSNPLLSYLVATGPVQIEHQRAWDTHETLDLLYDAPAHGEVIWEIRRQREHTPEGWRQVAD